MSDVFVSYSRKDLSFAGELVELLEREGLEVWVDLKGLYAGEEFWPEVQKAIDAAPAMVYVISPDSVASRFCGMELDHAIGANKRLVPVCYRKVADDELRSELSERQWVLLGDDDDRAAAIQDLVAAVRADWEWLRSDARLLVRAREWEAGGQDGSLVLRGRELRQAEEWLGRSQGEERRPTPLHRRFIEGSREAARRRRLRIVAAVAASLAGFAVLGWLGLAARVASLNNLSLDDLNSGQVDAALARMSRADGICSRLGAVIDGCREAGMTLGRAYLDDGQYGLAVERFDRALAEPTDTEADPVAADRRATAHQNRAYAHIMLAEEQEEAEARVAHYARAEENLDAAVEIFGQSEAGVATRPLGITRGRILLGRGEYERALEELERAARMSNAPDVDLLLAVAYRCQGDPLGSLRHFKRYITELEYQDQDPHWLRNRNYFVRLTERCKTEPL